MSATTSVARPPGVLGIAEADAVRLAAAFGNNAIVFIAADAPPRLVVTAAQDD